MTIEEVKQRRDELADQIAKLVVQFELDTKVEVKKIRLKQPRTVVSSGPSGILLSSCRTVVSVGLRWER